VTVLTHPSHIQENPATFLHSKSNTADVFELDYDLLTLRAHACDIDFTSVFREGVNAYLAGDWGTARVCLEKADFYIRLSAPVLGGDGPSRTLLRYMSEEGYEAPVGWKGFRPLTSK